MLTIHHLPAKLCRCVPPPFKQPRPALVWLDLLTRRAREMSGMVGEIHREIFCERIIGTIDSNLHRLEN